MARSGQGTGLFSTTLQELGTEVDVADIDLRPQFRKVVEKSPVPYSNNPSVAARATIADRDRTSSLTRMLATWRCTV